MTIKLIISFSEHGLVLLIILTKSGRRSRFILGLQLFLLVALALTHNICSFIIDLLRMSARALGF